MTEATLEEELAHEEAVASLCFVGVPLKILRRTDLTPIAKLVYGYIAFRLGSNENAWPGQDTIARDLGVSERAVRLAVASLIEAGLVLAVRRGLGQTNLYRLADPNARRRTGGKDGSRPPEGAESASPEGQNLPLQTGKNCLSGEAEIASRKEKEKRKGEKDTSRGGRRSRPRTADVTSFDDAEERQPGPFQAVEEVLRRIAERYGQPLPHRRDVLRHLKEWDPLRRMAETYGPERTAEAYIREADRRLAKGRNDPPTWNWLLEHAGVVLQSDADRLARLDEEAQRRYERLKALAEGKITVEEFDA